MSKHTKVEIFFFRFAVFAKSLDSLFAISNDHVDLSTFMIDEMSTPNSISSSS
jgi:hypothetical protein